MARTIAMMVFSFLLIFAIFEGFRKYKNGQASQAWPTTEGVILSSEVRIFSEGEETIAGKKSDTYEYNIIYGFRVKFYDYESDKIRLIPFHSTDPQEIQAIVDQYPPGERVTVYYNPDDPFESLLELPDVKKILKGYSIGAAIIALLLFITYKCKNETIETVADHAI